MVEDVNEGADADGEMAIGTFAFVGGEEGSHGLGSEGIVLGSRR